MIAPKNWGYTDTYNIDYLCYNKHIVEDSLEKDNEIDAIIINKPVLNNYNDDTVNNIITRYFDHSPNGIVLDLRDKYNEFSYNSQAKNIANPNYLYDLCDSSIIIDNYRSKRVFAFASSEGDETSLYSQLSFFDYLSRKGNHAVIVPSRKIISDNNRVVNFDWSLYKRIPICNFFIELKKFMDTLIYSDSDVIIIGIPEIIMNVNKKNKEGIGILPFVLSQILKIDAWVINIPSNGYSIEVLSDIRELIKKRYECGDVYIVNSNILYQKDDGNKDAPMFLSSEKLVKSGAQNDSDNHKSFSIFDELKENLVSRAILNDYK